LPANELLHTGSEKLTIGVHFHEGCPKEQQQRAAEEFVRIYDQGTKGSCELTPSMQQVSFSSSQVSRFGCN
jgi:hypothetical protein